MPSPSPEGEAELCEFTAEHAFAALQSLGDAVICTDRLSRVCFLNPIAEELTGLPAHVAVGRPLVDVLTLYDEAATAAAINVAESCLREGAPFIREDGLILISRTGRGYDIGLSAAPIRTPDDRVLGSVIVFNNVTTIRAQQKRLAHTALHDSLTGLPNRASFLQTLQNAIHQARTEHREHVLCFVDLDRFKRVNDRAGHAAGDALLAQAARIISSICGQDIIVARMGGDEFALLMSDMPIPACVAIGEKVVHAVRGATLQWKGQVFRIGASIGMTRVNQNSSDLGEVLHEADKACYAAKEKGRNRVCVYGRRPAESKSLSDDTDPARMDLH